MSASGGVTRGGGQQLALLAASISGVSGRVVVDRTGLSGRYEYVLKFSSNPERPIEDYPNIFTALQEQLGLKLESERGRVEVLVIDHIDRPTEN
jgi:uncharacterized protein (TIGR03435 family)